MSVYRDLGVRPIINAKGPSTRVSGGFLSAEVAAAMAEAGEYCVDMTELQAAASAVIAPLTGAEAGIVTAGASAGLLLGTAACLAGLDPAKMARLPDTTAMKNEVIMARSQRNFYDHAVRAAGARIIEAGLPDRFAGAGVRDTEAWEMAAAVNERTAAFLWVAHRDAQPPLEEVVAVARRAGVPLLVDAAGQLPPASNLRHFIAAGADLVTYSGGKAIAGPQGSGILCGRRDLIMSAILQNLDLDIAWEQWNPPAALIDKHRLPGLPPHGIGRSAKVGKETIAGLLVALRRFAAEDDATREARWLAVLEALSQRLGAGVAHAISDGPVLEVYTDGDALPLIIALQNSQPSIQADAGRAREGIVVIRPSCLRADDLDPLAARLNELLAV